MNKHLLRFPNKKLRSEVIKSYMSENGYNRAVCFTCGNAARELRALGVNVIEISPSGDFSANRWFSMAEIKSMFPSCFDATSGHLSMDVMNRIAERYKEYLGDFEDSEVYVPSGSGETIVCLKMAYPSKKFVAVYNLDKATEYNSEAPLNGLVLGVADKIIFSEE